MIVKIADCLGVDCHYLMTGIEAKNYVCSKELGLSGEAIQALMGFPEEEAEELNFLLTAESFREFLKTLHEYREYRGRKLRNGPLYQALADGYEKEGGHFAFTDPENSLDEKLLRCAKLNLHECVSDITRAVDTAYRQRGISDNGQH